MQAFPLEDRIIAYLYIRQWPQHGEGIRWCNLPHLTQAVEASRGACTAALTRLQRAGIVCSKQGENSLLQVRKLQRTATLYHLASQHRELGYLTWQQIPLQEI